MIWKIFETQSPELAEFARSRLHNQVAYLATIRKDGSPRVHPFTPIIGESGEVFLSGKAAFFEDAETRTNRVLRTITMLKQGKREK